jgi:hypothetical protein
MNKLVIGLADKTEALTPSKPGFLLIDDVRYTELSPERFKSFSVDSAIILQRSWEIS